MTTFLPATHRRIFITVNPKNMENYQDTWTRTIPASKEPSELYLHFLSLLSNPPQHVVPGVAYRIPSSRDLAKLWQFPRGLVRSVMERLTLEGLIVTRPWEGTFATGRTVTGTPVQEAAPGGGTVDSGQEDPVLPPALVKKFYSFQQELHNGVTDQTLNYIRHQVRSYLGRLIAADQELMLAPGIPFALQLVAESCRRENKLLALETPCPRYLLRNLEGSGVPYLPIPVDENGMRTDLLEDRCQAEAIGAVLLSPFSQLPTTAVLSPERLAHLDHLSFQYELQQIFQCPDHEFIFEPEEVKHLLPEGPHPLRIYIGPVSRLLPLRDQLAFISGSPEIISVLDREQRRLAVAPDLVAASATARLIEKGIMAATLLEQQKELWLFRQWLQFSGQRIAQEQAGFSLKIPAAGLCAWMKLPAAWQESFRDNPLWRSTWLEFYYDDPGYWENYVRIGTGTCSRYQVNQLFAQLVKQ